MNKNKQFKQIANSNKNDSCSFLVNTGECKRTTRYQLGISNQTCNACRHILTLDSSLSQLIEKSMYDYVQMRIEKELDFILIGEFGQYAVNPYVGTAQCNRFRHFQVDEFVPYRHTSIEQCRVDSRYMTQRYYVGLATSQYDLPHCTTHILLKTVSVEDWDLMTDQADQQRINIIVHDEMGLANVSSIGHKMSMYTPGTKRMDGAVQIETVEKIPCPNKHRVIDSFEVSCTRPIFANFFGGLKSLFTQRYVSNRYITYNEVKIKTTDNMLKWSAKVMQGGYLPKVENICNQVIRLRKNLSESDFTPKNPWATDLLALEQMGWDEQDQQLTGLVLYHVQYNISKGMAITEYLKKHDTSLLQACLSVVPKLCDVENQIIDVPAHTCLKPIPEQKEGSHLSIVQDEVNPYPFITNFVGMGPDVNYCTTLVPPSHSETVALQALLARQNAASIPVKRDINQVFQPKGDKLFKAHMDAFVADLKENCSYAPISLEQVVANTPPTKRARYQKALNNVQDKAMVSNPDYANTIRKSFIKQEKLYSKIGSTDPKSFRVIQGVSDEATLLLQTCMMPFSKRLAKLHNTDSILNKFCYTNGMNSQQIGGEVDAAIKRCGGDYWVIENDFTLYDASQGQWCHELEKILLDQCAETNTDTHDLKDPAVNILGRQQNTVGFISDRKTGSCIKYSTPYTRKSGDANTSVGNSTVNICATNYVYKQADIMKDLELCLVLGDDGLTIVRGKFPKNADSTLEESVVMAQNFIEKRFARLGLKAKVKISLHISEAEYCSSIFAPTVSTTGQRGHTLIPKLGRVVLKFNNVKAASLKGMTRRDYVDQNLISAQNALQFYPGLTNFQALLESAKQRGVKPLFEDFYNMHRTPTELDGVDFAKWDYYLERRYGLVSSDIFTTANLTSRGYGEQNVHIPWFDQVAMVDF